MVHKHGYCGQRKTDGGQADRIVVSRFEGPGFESSHSRSTSSLDNPLPAATPFLKMMQLVISLISDDYRCSNTDEFAVLVQCDRRILISLDLLCWFTVIRPIFQTWYIFLPTDSLTTCSSPIELTNE